MAGRCCGCVNFGFGVQVEFGGCVLKRKISSAVRHLQVKATPIREESKEILAYIIGEGTRLAQECKPR